MVGLFGGAAKISLPEAALLSKRMQGVFVGRLQQLKELMQLVANIKVWISEKRLLAKSKKLLKKL